MSKKILRKIIKNGVEYEIEGQKVFIITEDLVSVTQDATKGVSPYSTSYGYTNIDINANAGIKWVEGAIYSFVVNTEMVVASAYRNVRVRIGNGAYIPMKNRANSILAGSSYMTKGRTQFFVYKTVYETGGALHLNTDTSYSAMSVAEGKTGTATSNRVMRADYLKQIIEYHISQNLPTIGNGTITLEDESGNELGSFGLNDTGDKTIVIPAGGGGGDIDTNGVNALIDLKLGNYDSLFQMKSGLYKILNSIDEDDELGLTSGETRNDIIANASSMSKISHCYAVMCMIVNSEYAFNNAYNSQNGFKEFSECWNSITIIAENKKSRDKYLSEEKGIIKVITEDIVQNAFGLGINDILNDSKLFNLISDENFFTYFLEDENNLSLCVNSTNGKTRINNYSADDLLPAIYYWTEDYGYTTFQELAEDETAFEEVQNSEECMLIIQSNDEMNEYLHWKPGENTFLYYSFDGDVLDHSGNGRNGRIQQTVTYDMSKGYKGVSTGGYGLLPELGTMGTFTTSLWFRTTTTAGGNILTIGSYGNGDNSNLDQNFSNGKLHIQIWKGSNSHEEIFSSLTANDGKRHNLIVVKNGTSYSIYFDKTLISSFTDSTTIKGTANGSSYRTHPNFGSSSIFSGDLDEVIIETSAWSVENVNSYYDKMKKYYSN